MRTQRKRRKENKTDYKLRLRLLKSGIPRIVIRKTNNYIIIQTVESIEAQDKAKFTTTSKELLNYGWDKKYVGSLKSLPAAYLTGLVMAKKIGKGKFILDLGMIKNIHGSRIYATVKGLVDGGLNIPVNESIYPSEDRLNGEHLKEELKKVIIKVKEKLK